MAEGKGIEVVVFLMPDCLSDTAAISNCLPARC